MPYQLFASTLPVPAERRDTMIGLRFETEAQALERACSLHRAGWYVYRVSGPDGFEMNEAQIALTCGAPAKA